MPDRHKATLDIASDGAREAIAKFNLAHIRVWLRDAQALPVIAGQATAQSNITYGGLRDTEIVARMDGSAVLLARADVADRDGIVPDGAFFGAPLRVEDTTYGYVESYADGALSFADAAAIETWATELAQALAFAEATTALESPARGHVLLADDDPSIRKLLQTLLTRKGFTVTAVENGQVAYETARTSHPDLILLDWMMPILDGRSTAMRLKSDAETRNIPIVMLTSQARTEDKISALEAGAQDYLTKPFDSRELVARIEQQLRWRKLLADDDTDAKVAAPASTRPANPIHDDGSEPPTPPDGDYWTAAVQAQQIGKLRHALSYFVQEAEQCDHGKLYPRAAIAFRSASVAAGQLQQLDLSNKLLRLSGKMYLSWAENTSDGKAMEEAYVNAARCFLSAGNLKLARKSVEIAESMHSVMADDRPPSL